MFEKFDFSSFQNHMKRVPNIIEHGKILESKGLVFTTSLSKATIGSLVEFKTDIGETTLGEVVSLNSSSCVVMPYEELSGINSSTRVTLLPRSDKTIVSNNLLGRVIDYRGQPLDDLGPIKGPFEKRALFSPPINPLKRPQVSECLSLGINAIDGFTTVGKGQRMAILAGSGVGKSVLIGMIAKNTNADINIIALIGERGREVREFIENDLGEEGLKRSVVIVATSDTSALIRLRSAYFACTIAEYFRDQSQDVLFMMDSITRFSMAQREISLSAGEAPGQKGYTPSVFSKLPKLMERAGNVEGKGSITGIYSVLVEGGDMDEPITDAVRAISDGHIQLSRDLASRNHFPAIDVLSSISRVMNKVVSKEHKIVSSFLRDLMASYKEAEELINVGAYLPGTNPKIDKAVKVIDDINNFLKQDFDFSEHLPMDKIFDHMVELARKAEGYEEPVNEAV